MVYTLHVCTVLWPPAIEKRARGSGVGVEAADHLTVRWQEGKTKSSYSSYATEQRTTKVTARRRGGGGGQRYYRNTFVESKKEMDRVARYRP